MLIDLKLLGSKVQRYREQFEATTSEVSGQTGISEKRLVGIEAGRDEPTGDEILILADYFKCDYKFFVSNEIVAPFEQTETLFRSKADALSKDDRWAIQEFLYLCDCEEFLITTLQKMDRRPFSFRKRGKHVQTHGRKAAAALRRHLGYSSPKRIPDVYPDFRAIRLHVFRRKLRNSDISGLFIKHPTAGKCILVNYTEDVYRQRFSIAHEAGHAILDDEKDFVLSLTWDPKDLSEIRANAFASRYLIPEELLNQIPNPRGLDHNRLAHLADQLKVNPVVILYALKDTNLISQTDVERLKEVKIPAMAKEDPEIPPDLSPRQRERRQELLRRGLSVYYVELCFEAYHHDHISVGRLAEMLLGNERELVEIADSFGIRLAYAG